MRQTAGHQPGALRKPRDRCPSCNSGWIWRRGDGKIGCHTCDALFTEDQAIKGVKPGERKTNSGSGVVAGKIEIGGGYRWGSQAGPWDWR